jgi:hypothetical protein
VGGAPGRGALTDGLAAARAPARLQEGGHQQSQARSCCTQDIRAHRPAVHERRQRGFHSWHPENADSAPEQNGAFQRGLRAPLCGLNRRGFGRNRICRGFSRRSWIFSTRRRTETVPTRTSRPHTLRCWCGPRPPSRLFRGSPPNVRRTAQMLMTVEVLHASELSDCLEQARDRSGRSAASH